MKLLIDPEAKQAYRSLVDDHPARLPEFVIGDVLPISVGLIPRIVIQWDVNIFAPLPLTDWTVRVGIGGFALPVSGTFPISYASVESDLSVSAQPTADELATALNAIAAIDSLGGVDVTGGDGFFVVTFREDGVRELIEADPAVLVPVSIIEITQAVEGTVSAREVQTLRIRQDVGTLAELGVDSESPAITVTLVTLGTGSANHKIRLTFPSDRWNGSWTFSALTGTSDLISYAASQEQMEAAIAAMVAIGTGNVSVTQEDEDNFLVMFKNGRGNQEITGISADGTSLGVIGTKSGELDLRTPGMEFLIPSGKESAITVLEIEATPSGGSPEKILRRAVILHRPAISTESSIPVAVPHTYTLLGLTGFTGGGMTKVDGAAKTAGKALGSLYRGVVSGTLYEWELQAGTAVSDAPGIIRPTDYNALTNTKNLILVG